MIGKICDNFIGSATFKNEHSHPATIKATFKSGTVREFTVAAGGSTLVENDIQKETWTERDPVLGLEVTVDGKTEHFNDPSTTGMELREYTIGADHKVTRNK